MVDKQAVKEDTGKSPTSMSDAELVEKMAEDISESPTEKDVKPFKDSSPVKDASNDVAKDVEDIDERSQTIPRSRFDKVISERNQSKIELERMKSEMDELRNSMSNLQNSNTPAKSDVLEVKEEIADKREEYIKTLVEGGIEENTARVIANANFKVFDRQLNSILKELREKEINPLKEGYQKQLISESQKAINQRVEDFKKTVTDFDEYMPDIVKVYRSYSREKQQLLDEDPDGIEFLYNKAKKLNESSDKAKSPAPVSNQIKGRSTSRDAGDPIKKISKMSKGDLEERMREEDESKI